MSLRILAVAAVLVAACVGLLFWERDASPRQALEIKKMEVEEAITRSEAQVYAPAAARSLRDSMVQVEVLFDAQSGRLPFLRNWGEVRRGLQRIDELIARMEAEARGNKEALRASTEAEIARARSEADAVDGELATAPPTKDRRALNRLRADLAEVRTQIARVQQSLDEGHVHSAHEEIGKLRMRLAELLEEIQQAKQRARELGAAAPATPHGAVLVVDVAACRFTLVDGGGAIRLAGPCSTGSDSTFHGAGGRTWSFATPRGLRRVHHKAARPVWAKPDWAYLEEGLPVPPPGAPERLVRGMLGPYALDIGGGYLLHGSPYRSGLGERNTHGCIRMGDADLQVVYETLQVGDLVVLR